MSAAYNVNAGPQLDAELRETVYSNTLSLAGTQFGKWASLDTAANNDMRYPAAPKFDTI